MDNGVPRSLLLPERVDIVDRLFVFTSSCARHKQSNHHRQCYLSTSSRVSISFALTCCEYHSDVKTTSAVNYARGCEHDAVLLVERWIRRSVRDAETEMVRLVPRPLVGYRRQGEPGLISCCKSPLLPKSSVLPTHTTLDLRHRHKHELSPQPRIDCGRHADDAFPTDFLQDLRDHFVMSSAARMRTCSFRILSSGIRKDMALEAHTIPTTYR